MSAGRGVERLIKGEERDPAATAIACPLGGHHQRLFHLIPCHGNVVRNVLRAVALQRSRRATH